MKRILNIFGFVLASVVLANATGNLMNRYLYQRNIVFRESVTCENTTVTSESKYAVIVHGWRESCTAQWVIELARNLKKFRTGCLICMDYSYIAQTPNYLLLTKETDDLSRLLSNKLYDLESRGYDPNNGYMFGFSLGGRIVLEAGRIYGKQKIAEIDVCDNAGPGFDIFEQHDSKESAQNVQCIHTSRDKGTRNRDCHQDWNMGFCGRRQMAAGVPPRGSHGLCPVFYNAAFHFDFYAEVDPKQCTPGQDIQYYWPKKFKMGYMEHRKFDTTGEFFASTTVDYPYSPNAGTAKSMSALRKYRNKVQKFKNKWY